MKDIKIAAFLISAVLSTALMSGCSVNAPSSDQIMVVEPDAPNVVNERTLAQSSEVHTTTSQKSESRVYEGCFSGEIFGESKAGCTPEDIYLDTLHVRLEDLPSDEELIRIGKQVCERENKAPNPTVTVDSGWSEPWPDFGLIEEGWSEVEAAVIASAANDVWCPDLRQRLLDAVREMNEREGFN